MTKLIVNVSGESREFKEKGFIYEFPFPSKNPTKVPDDIAEKLLKTGFFKIWNTNHEDNITKKQKFKQELIGIHSIGAKTALDIMRIYPTRELLIKAIKNGKDLPIFDNMNEAVKKYYGGK